MSGNTFYGAVVGFSSSSYPNNTFFSSQPTGVKTFVRASAYEAGRANITVYNWANQSTVSVDVSSILSNGDGYEVRNVQDFFGAPVLTGTYNGGSLVLPMTGLSVATPYGTGARIARDRSSTLSSCFPRPPVASRRRRGPPARLRRLSDRPTPQRGPRLARRPRAAARGTSALRPRTPPSFRR